MIEFAPSVFATPTLTFRKKISHIRQLWRTRRHLGKLDEARLKDVGLSPEIARKEARRWL